MENEAHPSNMFTVPREHAAVDDDSSSTSDSSSSQESAGSGSSPDVPLQSPSPSPSVPETLHQVQNKSSVHMPPRPDPEPEPEPPASPWALHPLVDGRIKWGDVSPQRAREMVQASDISRRFGDRKELGLPAEKPPIPAQQLLKEEAASREIRLRRGRALEEVKRLHARLQHMRESSDPNPSTGVMQGKEVSDLTSLLTKNLFMAFAPNPDLPPAAIDPMMEQIFSELADAFAAQLEENIEMAARLRAVDAYLKRKDRHPYGRVRAYPPLQYGQKNVHLPQNNPSSSESDGNLSSPKSDGNPPPFKPDGNSSPSKPDGNSSPPKPDISMVDVPKLDVAMPDVQRSKKTTSSSDGMPSGTESSDNERRNGNNGFPIVPNAMPLKSYLLGPIHGRIGLFVVNRPSVGQAMEPARGIYEPEIEGGVSNLGLGLAKNGQSSSEESPDYMQVDQTELNSNVAQASSYGGERSQTGGIDRGLREKVADLGKQREIPDDESTEIDKSDTSPLSKEATLRATLKSLEYEGDIDSEQEPHSDTQKTGSSSQHRLTYQVKETQHLNKLFTEEILKIRKQRDSAVNKAEAAEKKLQQLKKEETILYRDAEGLDTAQARLLRTRDRQISDLTMVRNNLRAEIVRRNGRVVGAHGEVTRERYDPERWKEAGRREQKGLPRIHRDAWGPEGDGNTLRKDWPLEYQPGRPIEKSLDSRTLSSETILIDRIQKLLNLLESGRGELKNAPQHADVLEAAIASLQLEIAIGYRGVREVFPEVEEGPNECLAGLIRIIREKRGEITGEIEGLQAQNEALASSVKSLEDRLREEVRSRGSGGRYCSDNIYGSLDHRCPSLQRSAAPSPSSISDDEKEEVGSQAAPNSGISERLPHDNSGSRHNPYGSHQSSSKQLSASFGKDSDSKDPVNQRIAGQGARQEPAEEELAGSEIPVPQTLELQPARLLGDHRRSGPHGSRGPIVAPGDIRAMASTSRSLALGQLNTSEQQRPASRTVAKPLTVETNKCVGPSTLKSASVVDPGHRRRDPTPTINQEARVAGASARPSTRHASPGVPTRAGTRVTRNPAPVYTSVAPQRRKRKAVGPSEGEPPRKRRQ